MHILEAVYSKSREPYFLTYLRCSEIDYLFSQAEFLAKGVILGAFMCEALLGSSLNNTNCLHDAPLERSLTRLRNWQMQFVQLASAVKKHFSPVTYVPISANKID